MKTKFPRAEAQAVADQIMAELEPFCQQITIAGSLRRGQPEVGDIELLFVPRYEDRQIDFFNKEPVDTAAEKINQWHAAGTIFKRPNVDGHFTWGPQNKLAVHTDSGIPVDFFSTKPENWWVALVIRTGSKETNLRLTTGAQARQRTLNAYGSGVTLQGGRVIPATSEAHVFELCGVPYLEPHERTF